MEENKVVDERPFGAEYFEALAPTEFGCFCWDRYSGMGLVIDGVYIGQI